MMNLYKITIFYGSGKENAVLPVLAASLKIVLAEFNGKGEIISADIVEEDVLIVGEVVEH